MSTWYSAQIDRSNSPRSSPRMRISYIWLSLSMYSVFSLFFLPSLITCPIFVATIPLYSRSFFTSQPSTYWFLKKSLECLFHQNLLEALWGDMSWDDTIQVSFFHKCGQFIWCSAFNVVVIVFFLDISFLVVGPTLLLSLKLIFLKWLTP